MYTTTKNRTAGADRGAYIQQDGPPVTAVMTRLLKENKVVGWRKL